ncbi:Pycsar system effector family protein [Aureimonas leprariae]|uniref:Pycsar effector protein domain-containing protein n=1 Tax=Plantimonas leprariae TaxID=2615207 RepID=A0A7V7PQT3_9HYPH|nr:Pycsar system effector family protein [Aureimonas leprariae]KAB0680750.1 hypothetical protein F6X38_07045 [Aureimonas leprariae]
MLKEVAQKRWSDEVSSAPIAPIALPAGAPPTDCPFQRHLMDANRNFVDQIRVADQKAAYIFTFVLALMVWSTETRKALSMQKLMADDPVSLAVTLLLLASIVVALGAAICVVLPRARPGVSVLYWGAWPSAGDRLLAARAENNPDFVLKDLMRNTETLAAICKAKYRLVILAFRSLLVMVIAYLGLLILPG